MTTTQSDTESTAALVRALNDPHRRHVLAYLRDHPSRTTVGRLTKALGTSEAGRPATAPATEETLRIELWHVHLPLLAQVGLVEFDTASETVALAGDDHSLTAALDTAADAVWTLDA